jgi:hypothetical protein
MTFSRAISTNQIEERTGKEDGKQLKYRQFCRGVSCKKK